MRGLLDLSRIESGTVAPHRSPLPARGLVAEAVESVRLPMEHAGIHVAIQIPDDLPLVSADRDQIVRVLSNLLINAMHASSRGASITVRAAARGDGVTQKGIVPSPQDS